MRIFVMMKTMMMAVVGVVMMAVTGVLEVAVGMVLVEVRLRVVEVMMMIVGS